MTYKGQECVRVVRGEFKGEYGYVRLIQRRFLLWIVLDSGMKVNKYPYDVEFVRENYFIAEMV